MHACYSRKQNYGNALKLDRVTKTGYSWQAVKVLYRQVVSKTEGDGRGLKWDKDRDRATTTKDTVLER